LRANADKKVRWRCGAQLEAGERYGPVEVTDSGCGGAFVRDTRMRHDVVSDSDLNHRDRRRAMVVVRADSTAKARTIVAAFVDIAKKSLARAWCSGDVNLQY